MKFKSLKTVSTLLMVSVLAAACTKKRDAAFSEDEANSVFAISEFGNIEDANSSFSLKTSNTELSLNSNEKLKAFAEQGLVAVEEANVPARLKFMFEDLQLSGQKASQLKIHFTVDRQSVTAWKEVTDARALTALEKQYAKAKDQVILSQKIQKARTSAEKDALAKQLKTATLSQGSKALLVPIFKYAVQEKGIVQRIKNDLNEETSRLTLKPTDWDIATHIKINPIKDALNPVGLNATDKDQLDRTFAVDKINNQVMTAAELNESFSIKTALNPAALLLTSVDDEGLNVFEISDRSRLSTTELELIKSGAARGKIETCSDELKARLGSKAAADCVVIYRLVVPVNYVKIELPAADRFGSESATATLKSVPFTESVGLVSIPEMAQPQVVTADQVYDSSTFIRIADIKNAEFFFRRTLADAPLTTTFMPGEAGALQIVKFEMQDQRLVVRKADKLVDFKTGSNQIDVEDIMSIPVSYYRRELVDSRGVAYAFPRWTKTNKEKAEYVALNWANNTLPETHSPIAYYGAGQCLGRVADQVVSKVDMRLNEGVLNFTYAYTAALAPTEACLGIYDAANDYNPGALPAQLTARLEERISFLKKDENKNQNHTDTSFVPSTPFPAQNALGYGVWTIGKLNPTQEGGSYGREGQQIDIPVVHDFRNGRQLVYTVTNLPKDDAKKAQLFKETTMEIVAAWNAAYRKAFAGIPGLDRQADYVVVQFDGENGVKAELGDLDKNIIHFENKVNDNHGVLGVSQVGINNRSGIVIADSLIVYAGNLAKYVESTRTAMKRSMIYQQGESQIKTQANKQTEVQAVPETKAGAGATQNVVDRIAQQMNATSVGAVKATKSALNPNIRQYNVNLIANRVSKAVGDRKALGGIGAFKYAPAATQEAWIERAFRRAIEEQDIANVDVEGIIAEEMLSTMGSRISQKDRLALKKRVSVMNIRNQVKARFAQLPGCMLTMGARDALGTKYVNGDFYSALKTALYFDLGHEMGHSQGLTHNFIGSFDKANFKKDDAGKTLNNYSSIMDYIDPAQLQWSGLGLYDSHALRAAHTGLIEIAEGDKRKALIESMNRSNIKVHMDKYIHVDDLKKLMKGSWQNVSSRMFANLLKPYKYCTDIHVGYEPVCQRFDVGGSASEIVDNLIAEIKEHQISSYNAWDRNSFTLRSKGYAISRTMSNMISMRQFFDETMYALVIRNKSQEELMDYLAASQKVYFFLNGMITAPDALTAPKDLNFPFEIDAQKVTLQDGSSKVVVFERRQLQDIAITQDRLLKVGAEGDKILAMQLLTLKGLPYEKYYSANIEFSFLDFEKYLLGMSAQDSLTLMSFAEMIQDELTPVIFDNGSLIQLNGQNTVTANMKYYSAISTILGLESNTLEAKDNFANLFKVGSSFGKTPSDRTSLTQLGVDKKSSARTTFWAPDNALISGAMIERIAILGKTLDAETKLGPSLEKMALAQLEKSLMTLSAEDTAAAERVQKAIESAKLETARTLQTLKLFSDEEIAANAELSPANLAEGFVTINENIANATVALLVEAPGAARNAAAFNSALERVVNEVPVLDLLTAANLRAAQKISEQNKGKMPVEQTAAAMESFLTSGHISSKYGAQMKMLEFMNKLTSMVNPEYIR